GVRALDLEAPQLTLDGLAVRARRGPRVELDVDVVALAALPLQIVRDGGAADEGELLLRLPEEDSVSDDVSLRGHRDELLGHVDLEVRHAVDSGVGDQLERVRAGDE